MRVYLKSVAVSLLLTATGKLLMALGNARPLDMPSPIIGFLSNRELISLAAGSEVAIAILILSNLTGLRLALGAVAVLATVFVGYRLMLWLTGFHGYCDCLGNITDSLNLRPEQADRIALGMLLYFLVGSCTFLVGAWRCGLALRMAPAARAGLNRLST